MLQNKKFSHACLVLALLVPHATLSATETSTPEKSEFSDLNLGELLELDLFTSASLLPVQKSRAPGTVYSFHQSDFARYGIRRLEDLLQFVPGIQLNQYRKRHKSIWARGLVDRFNDKMVLMVDGVRMQHLYYGHFSLGDNFPLERVEKVEVILGPASSLYGANAFAGIISVTTRDFTQQSQLTVNSELADNSRAKVTALYNSEKVQLFASYLDQDAPFDDGRLSFIGRDTLQPLDENYRNFQLKLLPLAGLTLALDYQQSETPYLFIPDTQDAYIDEEHLTLSAHYEMGEVATGRLQGTMYYKNDDTREFELEQVSQSLGYEEFQDATLYGASLTGLKQYGDHTLALGVSVDHEEADKTRFERRFHFRTLFYTAPLTGDLLVKPGISSTNVALFVQDVWQLQPNLDLTLGVRYDDYESFDSYVNYRAALVYVPVEQRTFKFHLGSAIRTPTLREYMKVLEGTSYRQPALDPEQIQTLELSYLEQWQRASLNINLFYNHLHDFIVEMPTPDDADEYFANLGSNLNYTGVETQLEWQLLDNLRARITATYLQSDNNDMKLPYLAKWSGSLNVEYQLNPDHAIGLSVIHNSRRADMNDFDQDNAERFYTPNLHASGRLSHSLRYRAGIDNVFNAKEFDPEGEFGGLYNRERNEREIWLSLEWTLDGL